MHPVIQQVTERILARSEKSRAIYLQRMEKARRKGPHRGALACAIWRMVLLPVMRRKKLTCAV